MLRELADTREEMLIVLSGMMREQFAQIDTMFSLAGDLHNLISDAAQRRSEGLSMFLSCVARSLWGCTRLSLSKTELILCGLGEEAKSLSRLQIEGIEMLNWLLVDPSRASKALLGRLPKAGIRAKEAGSPYWEARDHLSRKRAHFSIEDASPEDASPKAYEARDASIAYLKTEIGGVFADLSAALAPAVSSLAAAEVPNHQIADQAEAVIEAGFRSFGIIAIASFGVSQGLPKDQQASHRYRGAWPEITRFP